MSNAFIKAGKSAARNSLTDKAIAAYLGLALGDALGATVEFLTPREITVHYGIHDRIRGGGWLRLRPGQVTDDTTMSLALGRAILEAGTIDPLPIARAFDTWMREKPVDIGNTVRRGIVRFRVTGEPLAEPGQYDAGNGAAMRVLPVALATLRRPEAEVRAACRTQAWVTHNNPLSDAACECLGLMLQDAIKGADKAQLLRERVEPLVNAHPAFAFNDQRRDHPGGYIVDTLQAVFQSLFETETLRDCLINVVNRGGDADTTGAIAGMLAGALYGTAALPRQWLKVLEAATIQSCRNQALALLEIADNSNTPRTAPAL